MATHCPKLPYFPTHIQGDLEAGDRVRLMYIWFFHCLPDSTMAVANLGAFAKSGKTKSRSTNPVSNLQATL